ncbi:MAG: TolC family protein [Pseudomonadota bacterium]|nr:TolC family protein [Pseudomonadota bacterium]
MKRPLRWLLLALAAPLQAAQAADLWETWQAARDHAPAALTAQAERAVGSARGQEAQTLWRPNVNVSASAGLGTLGNSVRGANFSAPGFGVSNGVGFNTSVYAGVLTRLAVEARQPLLDRARQAQMHQLELADQASGLQWQAQNQALMIQTASDYFDVVLAEHRQAVLEREQRAVEYALAETRARFATGAVPVTDTHEANARAESIRAELIALQNEAEYRRAVLADAVGAPVAAAASLAPPRDPALPPLEPHAWWLDALQSGNPQLRARLAAGEAKREEARKFAHEAATTVDLVAQLSQDRLSGGGEYGSASTLGHNGMIGVQVSIPLLTGGSRDARQQEALRLADQADAETDQLRHQLEQDLGRTWRSLAAAPARLRALDAAVTASQARLEATRTGHQLGDRTTLDLLNAESEAARADLALTEGRIGMLIDRLRLAALGGRLDDNTLQAVNAALHPDATH